MRAWRVWSIVALLLTEIVVFGADATFGQEPSLAAIILLLIALIDAVALVQWVRAVQVQGRLPPPRAWKITTIVIGQASALVYFVIPLWMEAHSHEHDPEDLLICGVAVIGLLIAVYIVGRAVATQPAGAVKISGTILLALLPLAGSVQFWYSTIYRPAHARSDIHIEAALKDVGPPHARAARILATISLENTGSTDVDVLGAIYAVTGFGVPPVSTGMSLAQVNADGGITTPLAADTRHDYRGVVRIGRLMSPGGHLVVGQKLITSVVFAVDRNAFDKLRISVSLSTVVDLGQSAVKRTDGKGECTTFDLPVAGTIRRIIEDHPTARTCIAYGPGSPPDVMTRFGYADEEKPMTDSLSGLSGGDPNTRGFTTTAEFSLTDP